MRAIRLVLMALVATLPACADAEDAPTSPQGEGPVPPPAETIVMRDNVFEPSELSIPSEGGVIEVTLINEGSVQHNFSYQFQVGGSFGQVSNELSPGEQDVHDDEIPPGTRVDFHCRYHGGQGMTGTFVVT